MTRLIPAKTTTDLQREIRHLATTLDAFDACDYSEEVEILERAVSLSAQLARQVVRFRKHIRD